MNEIEQVKSVLKKINLIYTSAIEYDYNNVQAENHDEQCAGDYCRCSTIEDCKITKINTNGFIRVFKENLDIDINNNSFDSGIYNVCKDLSDDDFYFETCGGYYGEELQSITLGIHVVSKLANIFCIKAYRREKIKKIEENYISNICDIDKYVKKILIDEYGYVLDSLKNSKFTIIDINTCDVVFPQKEHNEYVKSGNLSSYKNNKGICGLVKIVNYKYLVIDGYHRINANLDKKTIKVILAY